MEKSIRKTVPTSELYQSHPLVLTCPATLIILLFRCTWECPGTPPSCMSYHAMKIDRNRIGRSVQISSNTLAVPPKSLTSPLTLQAHFFCPSDQSSLAFPCFPLGLSDFLH
ncbi:hypothetical protein VTK56DRAFT_9617 [Thermocarpiscus australiensis]